MKVYINGQGHMTKMAAMSINSKNLLKSSSPEPEGLLILKLGMKYQTMELYKLCINHDPGMTLTYLRQGQLGLPMHLNGENC